MKSAELTRSALPLSIAGMDGNETLWRRSLLALPVLGMMAGLGGCINVKAPDKPIVIELNINIKQEVVYRLAADASNTIEDNPDIF
ncbi:YnbE family lipoprotein [Novosphingobium sp. ZN18A2]|uniref:YnbE family lipoprotein n=1 Tax=Novosphingobium sp. ZN18A2 TaxID=3079861 RepID=UPI0030D4A9F5